jgi:hypothetical protein
VLARCNPSETRLMFTTMRAAGFKLKNKVLESLMWGLFECSKDPLKDLDVSCIEYTYSKKERPAILSALLSARWDKEPLLVRRLATAPCYGAEAVMWRDESGWHIGMMLVYEIDNEDGGEERAIKTALRSVYENEEDDNDKLRGKAAAAVQKELQDLRQRHFAELCELLAIVATRLSEAQCKELFSDPKFVKYAERDHFVPATCNILAEVLKQRAEQKQQAEARESG